jgi:hypothetical protein
MGGQGSGDGPAPQEGPSRESTDRQGRGEQRSVDSGRPDDLLKSVWGSLPERLRDQVQQSSGERFLPGFERQIEDYFRALSQRQRQERP